MSCVAAKTAPITSEVLAWVIDQGGLSLDDAAVAFGADADRVAAWLDGSEEPTIGELGRIAKAVDRPRAFFLLPRPPTQPDVVAQFRSRPGSSDSALSKTEVRRVRWVKSMQRLLSWIAERDNEAPVDLPLLSVADNPYEAGERERGRLGPSFDDQSNWTTPYDAVRAWSRILDDQGVLVTQLDLGKKGLRGFSLWDIRAPLIGVNSGLRIEVRSFTAFHEYAHLLTRSDAACEVGGAAQSEIERWCESFAAGFLLPAEPLRLAIAGRLVSTVDEVRTLARRYGVSARAMAIRLREIEAAAPGLYQAVEAALGVSDWTDSGGGTGETSAQKRLRQLGPRPVEMLMSAYERGDITLRDVQTHLRLDGRGVDEVAILTRDAG